MAALASMAELRLIVPVAWTTRFAKGLGRTSASRSSGVSRINGLTAVHPVYWYTPRILRTTYGRSYRWSVKRAYDRLAGEFDPSLVYAPFAYPDGWAAVRLAGDLGLPAVIKVMGSDVYSIGDVPGRSRGTIEALRQAAAVVCVSRDLARSVAELGIDARRIHVVYNGVDGARFTPGAREQARRKLNLDDRRCILFVGNLVPVKQIGVLIDACALLAREGFDFQCHLIGGGPLHGTLDRQVSQRELEQRVFLHGTIAHDCLPDWFRAADVVALPSRSEGVPNVLLEAIACGIPFVASNVGGIPEIATSGRGRLVASGSAAELASALGDVFKSQPRLPNEGASWPGWEESARQLYDVFASVLDSHDTTSAFCPGQSLQN
ncbi:MAG: glycosyltransferase [Thermoguttaceae bacterium]